MIDDGITRCWPKCPTCQERHQPDAGCETPRPPEGKHSPNSEWCCSCLDEMNAKLLAALEAIVEEYGHNDLAFDQYIQDAKALLKEAKK